MTARIAFAAVLLFVGLEAAVLTQHADDMAAIADIEQRLASAWLKGDRAFIDAILAPDWSVTDASGRILGKRQVIDETFGSGGSVEGGRRIESMVVDDVTIRMFGDTAVATGRTRATGSYQGKAASVVLRFTDVFVRRSGRWLIVASHASAVAP